MAVLTSSKFGDHVTMQSKATSSLENTRRVSTLSRQWRQTVAETCGEFVPSFTNKQRGQLGLLVKRVPPGTAGDVLDACIRDWIGFAKRAEAEAGAFSLPSKPEIGFLLKFVGVAVNFAQAGKAVPKLTRPAQPVASRPTRQRSPNRR